MVNKQPIGNHSDKYFNYGITRYAIAESIIENESWNDLVRDLKENYNYDDKEKWLYKEFKFYNCILIIEYRLCTLCNLLEKLNKIKNKKNFKKYLIRKIKHYRGIKNHEKAKKILYKEVSNDDFFTPHILLYVCGISLGEFIHIIENMINDFLNKNELLKKLREFNNCRTNIVHHLLSSRLDMSQEIENGIKTYHKLNNLINNIQS